MDLLESEDNNEGDSEMSDTQKNIWDSIEVEMSAEFDKVKINRGELKDIENGLVVDLTSLYDNNVTLKVEGKPIASGSLVIVNDRYGVKINNVIANGTSNQSSVPTENEEFPEEEENYEENPEENYETPEGEEENSENPEEGEGEDEFDYSDFELEDENI